LLNRFITKYTNMENLVMGIDIGGSHITAMLIDLNLKAEIPGTWNRSKLDSNAGADEIIEAWAHTITKSLNSYHLRPSRISIAMPGPMNYEKGICKIKNQSKYKALYDLNIKELLALKLGFDSRQINFVNDAACFLRGELFVGSLSSYDQAIGLTLGTGLGTSHTMDGKVYDSNLWKMPFKQGIAEDYISTRWFTTRFRELSGIEVSDVRDIITNHQSSRYFEQLFHEFSNNLAHFIYKFVRKKMPVAAVIGGNISRAEAYFLEDTRRILVEKMGHSFPIKISSLGEKAALIGAGAFFEDVAKSIYSYE